MNHNKRKTILALLVVIGLIAMVVALFLLSTPSTRAATLVVNSTADSGSRTLQGQKSLLSAPSTVAIVSAQTSSVPCLNTSSTLEDLVACICDYMPHRYSVDNRDGFDVPTVTEMTEWREVVGQMMEGECDTINLSGHDWGNDFTVSTFTDTENSNTYCVFMETTYDTYPAGNRVTHGWGTFIYHPTALQELNISAPHAKYEISTAVEAVGIFKNTQSRTFLMTGAHRYASNVDSSCQSSYKRSDAAHNVAHMFHATLEKLMEYYGSYPCFYHLQFHGMGESSCDGVDVYLTHGVITAPVAGDKILKLKSNLVSRHPTWTVTVPGDNPPCDLHGSTNVQGRLLNDVAATDVCTKPASSYSGRFVHIEQKKERDGISFRDADNWIDAINNTWPLLTVTKQASPNPVQEGEQLTYILTVANTGGVDATEVQVTDTVPANTACCVSIGQGGMWDGNNVVWTGKRVTKCSSISLTFVVMVAAPLTDCTFITNADYKATSAEGMSTVGSPVTTQVGWCVYLPILMKNYPP